MSTPNEADPAKAQAGSQQVASPQRVLKKLRELRSRRRFLRATDGMLRTLIWAAILLWISFFLDWTLELPLPIRVFHIFAGLVSLTLGIKFFLFGKKRRISRDQLASEVESSVSGFEDSLLTAVQLCDKDNPRSRYYSSHLLNQTVSQAEAYVDQVAFSQLLSKKSVRFAGLLFVAIFASLLFFGFKRPDLSETYVRRNVLLEDVSWPREYYLEMLQPQGDQREMIMALGDSLTVVARKTRGGDARVRIHTISNAGVKQSATLKKKGEDLYRWVDTNLKSDFSFYLTVGDYRGPEYKVFVRLRPRIESIALSFDYPEYTGLTDSVDFDNKLGGHVKAPLGTIVSYRAKCSMKLEQASRIEESAVADAKPQIDELKQDAEMHLSGSFEVKQTGSYYFDLKSEDGFEDSNPMKYRVTVIADHAPTVTVDEPGKNLEVTLRAKLELELSARDDYGVVASEIVLRRTGAEAEVLDELRIPLPELVGEKSSTKWLFDLKELQSPEAQASFLNQEKLQLGDRVDYLVQSRDAIGQIGESRVYQITIVADDDLARMIQEDISIARERLEETLQLVSETRNELEDIDDENSRAVIRHARLGQERAQARLKEASEMFEEIANRVTQNRLTDVRELPWIQKLKERTLELSDREAKDSLEALDELARKSAEQEINDKDIETALDKVRSTERKLTEIIEDIEDWGDVRSVLRKLEELMRKETDLENKILEQIQGGFEEK